MKHSSLLFTALFASACASSGSSSKGSDANQTEGTAGQPASPASSSSKAPAAGAQAVLPDFSLETVEGETFTLSDHVGKDVVLMSFWATWCRPCMAELPHLESLYQDEKEKGLTVVAIAMDEPSTVAEVAPTAARLGLSIPVVLDTDQKAVALYNRSRDAPMTVIIDRKGKVVRASPGYNPGDEVALAEEIRGLLAQ